MKHYNEGFFVFVVFNQILNGFFCEEDLLMFAYMLGKYLIWVGNIFIIYINDLVFEYV